MQEVCLYFCSVRIAGMSRFYECMIRGFLSAGRVSQPQTRALRQQLENLSVRSERVEVWASAAPEVLERSDSGYLPQTRRVHAQFHMNLSPISAQSDPGKTFRRVLINIWYSRRWEPSFMSDLRQNHFSFPKEAFSEQILKTKVFHESINANGEECRVWQWISQKDSNSPELTFWIGLINHYSVNWRINDSLNDSLNWIGQKTHKQHRLTD